MSWRNQVDPIIKSHLERQIAESIRHRSSYEQANNPAIAQAWIAIANLSKEIFDINLKLKYLERALKEISAKRQLKQAKPKKEIKPKITL